MTDRRQASISEMKWGGIALGSVPLIAGFLDWGSYDSWQRAFHAIYSKPARFLPPPDVKHLVYTAVVCTLVCIALHVASFALRRGLMTPGVHGGLGPTAWRVLLFGCWLSGFVLGAILVFG